MERRKKIFTVLFALLFAVTGLLGGFVVYELAVSRHVSDSGPMIFESSSADGLTIYAVNAATNDPSDFGVPPDLVNDALQTAELTSFTFRDETYPFEALTLLKVVHDDGSEIAGTVTWSLSSSEYYARTTGGTMALKNWQDGFTTTFKSDFKSDPAELFLSLTGYQNEYACLGCKCPFFFPVTVKATLTEDGGTVSAECTVKYRESSASNSPLELGFAGFNGTISARSVMRTFAEDGIACIPLHIPFYAFALSNSPFSYEQGSGSYWQERGDTDMANVSLDGSDRDHELSFAEADVLRYNSGLRYFARLVCAANGDDSHSYEAFCQRELNFADIGFDDFSVNVLGFGSPHELEEIKLWSVDEETVSLDVSALAEAFTDPSVPIGVKPVLDLVDPYRDELEPNGEFYTFDLGLQGYLDERGMDRSAWLPADFYLWPGVDLDNASVGQEEISQAAQAYLDDPTSYQWSPSYYLKIGDIVLGVGVDFSLGPYGYQALPIPDAQELPGHSSGSGEQAGGDPSSGGSGGSTTGPGESESGTGSGGTSSGGSTTPGGGSTTPGGGSTTPGGGGTGGGGTGSGGGQGADEGHDGSDFAGAEGAPNGWWHENKFGSDGMSLRPKYEQDNNGLLLTSCTYEADFFKTLDYHVVFLFEGNSTVWENSERNIEYQDGTDHVSFDITMQELFAGCLGFTHVTFDLVGNAGYIRNASYTADGLNVSGEFQIDGEFWNDPTAVIVVHFFLGLENLQDLVTVDEGDIGDLLSIDIGEVDAHGADPQGSHAYYDPLPNVRDQSFDGFYSVAVVTQTGYDADSVYWENSAGERQTAFYHEKVGATSYFYFRVCNLPLVHEACERGECTLHVALSGETKDFEYDYIEVEVVSDDPSVNVDHRFVWDEEEQVWMLWFRADVPIIEFHFGYEDSYTDLQPTVQFNSGATSGYVVFPQGFFEEYGATSFRLEITTS